jgi:hypothetical protein
MKAVGIYPIQAIEPIHLVELEIEDDDAFSDIGEITQEIPDQRRDNWQVPYLEQLLAEDGTSLIAEDFEIPNKKEEWKESRESTTITSDLDYFIQRSIGTRGTITD